MRQLDSLRCFAVLFVLLQHLIPEGSAALPAWFPSGYHGVRLFFVLSGFLITGILLRCREGLDRRGLKAGFTARQFYIRRALRIFPVFYATLAVTALLNIGAVRSTLPWHVFYASNIYFALRGDWQGVISPFWSLAVEEQFYLLWPWLILFAPRPWLRPIIVLAILVGPVFRLSATVLGLNTIAVQVLLPGCLDSLGMGALLASVTATPSSSAWGAAWMARVSLLFGLPGYVALHYAPSLFVAGFQDLAFALFCTWLVAGAARGFRGPVGAFLSWSPFVYVGRISYGLYVVHDFMPHLVGRVLFHLRLPYPESPLLALVLLSAAAVVMATISYYGMERPINSLKRYFPYLLHHTDPEVLTEKPVTTIA